MLDSNLFVHCAGFYSSIDRLLSCSCFLLLFFFCPSICWRLCDCANSKIVVIEETNGPMIIANNYLAVYLSMNAAPFGYIIIYDKLHSHAHVMYV